MNLKSLDFAIKSHGNQKYGIKPYSYHLKKVVEIAKEYFDDREIIDSCALHDVLEDTNVSYSKLSMYFGTNTADIVFDVTDEIGRCRKERKEKTYPKTSQNWKAVAVKLCDRIANIDECILNDNLVKYAMYVSEKDDFEKSLKKYYHPIELDPLWERLNKLYK